MSREQSVGEDGVVTEVDETAETEVDDRPPRGCDRIPEDEPFVAGAIGAEADKTVPGQKRRFGPWVGPNRFSPPSERRPCSTRSWVVYYRRPERNW